MLQAHCWFTKTLTFFVTFLIKETLTKNVDETDVPYFKINCLLRDCCSYTVEGFSNPAPQILLSSVPPSFTFKN